ncbi:hypothetical protein [Sphingomonas sp. IC4-52]|uniref:hypothetical protein n=1 Tax=Sphingomonas sp. IC4-52 TaxID=2887202 RepID=UPI001D11310A|nr:hypothetical protein [Sphingomonas sp. IC4-52]MCC2978824.1 hypothetical protein [Sphingomonas sp. IC4-52]
MNVLALAVWFCAAVVALGAIIVTLDQYGARMLLALRGQPQIHLSRPRASHARTMTPRSLAPRDSLFLTPALSRPAHGQMVQR